MLTRVKLRGQDGELSELFLLQANKPLMEKRRRERINTSLEQLKSILMDVTKKEVILQLFPIHIHVHRTRTWEHDQEKSSDCPNYRPQT